MNTRWCYRATAVLLLCGSFLVNAQAQPEPLDDSPASPKYGTNIDGLKAYRLHIYELCRKNTTCDSTYLANINKIVNSHLRFRNKDRERKPYNTIPAYFELIDDFIIIGSENPNEYIPTKLRNAIHQSLKTFAKKLAGADQSKEVLASKLKETDTTHKARVTKLLDDAIAHYTKHKADWEAFRDADVSICQPDSLCVAEHTNFTNKLIVVVAKIEPRPAVIVCAQATDTGACQTKLQAQYEALNSLPDDMLALDTHYKVATMAFEGASVIAALRDADAQHQADLKALQDQAAEQFNAKKDKWQALKNHDLSLCQPDSPCVAEHDAFSKQFDSMNQAVTMPAVSVACAEAEDLEACQAQQTQTINAAKQLVDDIGELEVVYQTVQGKLAEAATQAGLAETDAAHAAEAKKLLDDAIAHYANKKVDWQAIKDRDVSACKEGSECHQVQQDFVSKFDALITVIEPRPEVRACADAADSDECQIEQQQQLEQFRKLPTDLETLDAEYDIAKDALDAHEAAADIRAELGDKHQALTTLCQSQAESCGQYFTANKVELYQGNQSNSVEDYLKAMDGLAKNAKTKAEDLTQIYQSLDKVEGGVHAVVAENEKSEADARAALKAKHAEVRALCLEANKDETVCGQIIQNILSGAND